MALWYVCNDLERNLYTRTTVSTIPFWLLGASAARIESLLAPHHKRKFTCSNWAQEHNENSNNKAGGNKNGGNNNNDDSAPALSAPSSVPEASGVCLDDLGLALPAPAQPSSARSPIYVILQMRQFLFRAHAGAPLASSSSSNPFASVPPSECPGIPVLYATTLDEAVRGLDSIVSDNLGFMVTGEGMDRTAEVLEEEGTAYGAEGAWCRSYWIVKVNHVFAGEEEEEKDEEEKDEEEKDEEEKEEKEKKEKEE
jgi:hypothetical protein